MSDLNSGVNNAASDISDRLSGISSGMNDIGTTVSSTIDSVISNMQDIMGKIDNLNVDIVTALKDTMASIQSAVSSGSGSGSTSGTGGSSGGSSGSTQSSSSSSSTGGASTGGSGFFIYSPDSYPKQNLNKDTSIVDRLKYHDFDSSFSARSQYYSKMGLSGTYTGTAEQNVKMLDWMKLNGYKNGVLNIKQGELARTQEGGKPEMIIYPDGRIAYPDGSYKLPDGSVLTPVPPLGSVIPADASKNLWNFANNPLSFLQEQMRNMLQIPSAQQNINNDNITNYNTNTVNLQLDTSGIHDKEEFLHFLTHDKRVEKALTAMTVGRAAGGSSLKKYNV